VLKVKWWVNLKPDPNWLMDSPNQSL